VISAVIITHNEERNIARCIESMADIANEIVIVDSFSTDKTREICERYPNVRFIVTEWKGYSATKNLGNQSCSGDFILSIDADEAVSEVLKRSINEAKLEENTVFEVNRLTNYCGKWIHYSGWYPDKKIRLFKKGVAMWEGDVHEKLKFTSEVKAMPLAGDLYHYSYYSEKEHLEKSRKYALLASEKLKNKNQVSLFIKMLFAPVFRFFRTYFLKLGFLDGFAGIKIAGISAYEVHLKYKWALFRD
jgi:glycosyltransferase involved in cell wall biosynthesis